MRSLLAAALLMLVLTGATCQRRSAPPVASPDAQCWQPCTPSLTDTGVRWHGDPEDPAMWDGLGEERGVVPTLTQLLLQCERRRQACAGFIQDIEKRDVIRAGGDR